MDADKADDIMDLTDHSPSQDDRSPGSNREPSADVASSSPPRKRSKQRHPFTRHM